MSSYRCFPSNPVYNELYLKGLNILECVLGNLIFTLYKYKIDTGLAIVYVLGMYY